MCYGSVVAAGVGVAVALTAPWVATFFHITAASMELAGGVVFFTYAIGLVFGLHFGENAPHDDKEGGGEAGHPVGSGFRELLLPFIVSPLGVAAALAESLAVNDWSARLVVAAAYAAVAIVDLIVAVAFAPLMRRVHSMSLEVLSRLLGILLSAVGVTLFLGGPIRAGRSPRYRPLMVRSVLSSRLATTAPPATTEATATASHHRGHKGHKGHKGTGSPGGLVPPSRPGHDRGSLVAPPRY